MGDFESTTKRISDLFSDENKSLLKIFQSMTFLLKGTPYLLYGDELELKSRDKKLMRWDSTENCGFSSAAKKLNDNCENNVKLQRATGAGTTLTRIYKSMANLRKEPSFQWGSIELSNKDETEKGLISFMRKAQDFEGYIITANIGKETKNVDFKKFFDLKSQEKGKVAYFYSIENNNHEFQIHSEVMLDNILLKPGDFLVVKFENN